MDHKIYFQLKVSRIELLGRKLSIPRMDSNDYNMQFNHAHLTASSIVVSEFLRILYLRSV
jgi:hypothetical protein